MTGPTRVRNRIFAVVFAAIGLAVAVAALAVAGNIASLHAVDELAGRNVPALHLVAVADINLQDSATELRLASSAPTTADRVHYRQEALDDLDRVDQAVAQAQPNLSGEGAREIARFPRPWQIWRSAISRQARQLRLYPGSSVLPLISSSRTLAAFHQADLALWDTVNIEAAATATQRHNAQAATRRTLVGVIAGAFVTLLLGMLLAIWLARSITGPLARVTAAATRLAQGDLTSRSGVSGASEIGQLGLSFDQMGERLAQVVDDLEGAQVASIRGLVMTLDARDPYTASHSVTVARYAADIARELDLDEQAVESLYLAGLVHDIGKVAIDGSVLRKPGRLSADEFEEVKLHPVVGEQIVRAVPSLRPLAAAVRWHHERADGTGYPDALRQGEIPLDASIIAVADTWNAMTSDRPYRAGLELDVALAELQRVAGPSLAREIVDAFLRVLEREDADYARGIGADFDTGSEKRHRTPSILPPQRLAA